MSKKKQLPIAVSLELENCEAVKFPFEAFKTFKVMENAKLHYYTDGEDFCDCGFGGGYLEIKKEFNHRLEGPYYDDDEYETMAFDRLTKFDDVVGIDIYYPDKKISIDPWIEEEFNETSNERQISKIDTITGNLILLFKSNIKLDINDPFFAMSNVHFEDGCLRPEDVEDYDSNKVPVIYHNGGF